MKTPETNYQDTNGKENKDKSYGLGVSNEDTETLKNKLENINDLIDHDQPVTTTDLSNLESALKNIKIDVGGGIFMTQAEIEKDEETLNNMKIWKEMSEGNFDNTCFLTRITPEVSKYLLNKEGIDLFSLTTAIGLILPQTVGGSLDLSDLTTIENLTLPQTVEGHLDLFNITSAEGLVLPQTVGGDIYLGNLPPIEIKKLKQQRPDLAYKIRTSY